jgi:hypothetical protein
MTVVSPGLERSNFWIFSPLNQATQHWYTGSTRKPQYRCVHNIECMNLVWTD